MSFKLYQPPIIRLAKCSVVPLGLVFAGVSGANAQGEAAEAVEAAKVAGIEQLAVADEVASDAAIYFGVEHAAAGLRQALDSDDLKDLDVEYVELVRELMEGEGEISLWAQAFGGDWGMAMSNDVIPWSTAYSKASVAGSSAQFLDSIRPNLQLLAGEITVKELLEEQVNLYVGGQQQLLMNMGKDVLSGIKGRKIPGMAFIVRPETIAGRDQLALKVEEGVAQIQEGMPPEIVRNERKIGNFNSRTFTVSFTDIMKITDMEMSVRDFVEQGIPLAEAKELMAWIETESLMIGYGWDDQAETFGMFIGSDPKGIPVARHGVSLLDEELGLAELAALAPADNFRIDAYQSEAYSRMSQELGGVSAMVKGPVANFKTLVERYPEVSYAQLINQALERAIPSLNVFDFEVTGSTIATYWLDDGFHMESLLGTVDPQVDMSQPIRWIDAVESDAMISLAGATTPHMLGAATSVLNEMALGILGYNFIETEAENQLMLGSIEGAENDFSNEVRQAYAVQFKEQAKTAEWLLSEKGDKASHAISRLGARLSAAMGEQEVFMMDFKGEMPEWAQASADATGVEGMPRMTWMTEVAHPEHLDGAWEEASHSVDAMINRMSGEDESVPHIPTPMHLKGDVATWMIAVQPFTGNDFLPVVARTGSELLMGTSLPMIQDVAELSEVKVAAEAPTGRMTRVRVGELAKMIVEAAEKSENEDVSDVVNDEQLKDIDNLVDSMGDLTIWERAEGERTRVSVSVGFEK